MAERKIVRADIACENGEWGYHVDYDDGSDDGDVLTIDLPEDEVGEYPFPLQVHKLMVDFLKSQGITAAKDSVFVRDDTASWNAEGYEDD